MWISRKYSRSKIRKAGDTLINLNPKSSQYKFALKVLNNWRASHSFPLNTFQIRLRTQAKRIDPLALIAQRLKRTPSIILKLKRFGNMSLERMQDIGGCRAILRDVNHVYNAYRFYKSNPAKHIFVKEYDYIKLPKIDGYRGIHLVYKYKSQRNTRFNGHQIEIQLRSRIQHAWATAVETAGTYFESQLKSGEGPKEWRELFKYISSGFAILENTNIVSNTDTNLTRLQEFVKAKSNVLKFNEILQGYNLALKHVSEKVKKSDYYLIILRPIKNTIEIRPYYKKQLKLATTDYMKFEVIHRNEKGSNVVLVSSGTVKSLEKTYPNYFLDTKLFFQYLKMFLDKKS